MYTSYYFQGWLFLWEIKLDNLINCTILTTLRTMIVTTLQPFSNAFIMKNMATGCCVNVKRQSKWLETNRTSHIHSLDFSSNNGQFQNDSFYRVPEKWERWIVLKHSFSWIFQFKQRFTFIWKIKKKSYYLWWSIDSIQKYNDLELAFICNGQNE